MAKYELLLTCTLKSFQRVPNERGGSILDLTLVWTVTDMESPGECRNFEIPGSGFDYESKGTAKALTDSRKSAMILIFNLKGGDDPERAPVTRAAAKEKQQEIADNKLANAAAGRGVDADTPALFYTWFEQSRTAWVSGDKELMKANADLLKEFKLGAKVVVNEAQLETLKIKLEERGIPFKKLQTA
jgi:hypothetical protein